VSDVRRKVGGFLLTNFVTRDISISMKIETWDDLIFHLRIRQIPARLDVAPERSTRWWYPNPSPIGEVYALGGGDVGLGFGHGLTSEDTHSVGVVWVTSW